MKKPGVTFGIGVLVIVIIAVVIALWPSGQGKLTVAPDDITLSWISKESLVAGCTAQNDSDKEWKGMVSLAIRTLDGKTLCDYTTKEWQNKIVKSGETARVFMKIPFSEIEGRYTEDTVIVSYTWGGYGAKKEFKI